MRRNITRICYKGAKAPAHKTTVFAPEALQKRRFRSHSPQRWPLLSHSGYRPREGLRKNGNYKWGVPSKRHGEELLTAAYWKPTGKRARGKAGKSGEEELFCKSTWGGKEPLWWRQGQPQTGALWIWGRQKTSASTEPPGHQRQRQHLQLAALGLFTHNDLHQSPRWLRPLQQKEWDKAEGEEATSLLCRRTVSAGSGERFPPLATHEGAALRGGRDGRAGQSSSSRLVCSRQRGSVHHPQAEDGSCLLPFFIIALLSCAFPSLHAPSKPSDKTLGNKASGTDIEWNQGLWSWHFTEMNGVERFVLFC